MSDDDIEMDDLEKINFQDESKKDIDLKSIGKMGISSELAFELFLKKIAEKSLGYKWMHDQDRYYYENMNYFFQIIDIIITAILAILTCGELSLIGFIAGDPAEYYYYVLGIQLFFMFCNLVIRGIREFTQYHVAAESHRSYAIKFSLINNKIQKKFTQNISEMDNGKNFVNDIAKSFNELLDTAPPIRKKIINKYIKEVDNQDSLGKQPIIGGYDKIEIIIDTNNLKTNIKPTNSSKENEYNYEMRRWLQYT